MWDVKYQVGDKPWMVIGKEWAFGCQIYQQCEIMVVDKREIDQWSKEGILYDRIVVYQRKFNNKDNMEYIGQCSEGELFDTEDKARQYIKGLFDKREVLQLINKTGKCTCEQVSGYVYFCNKEYLSTTEFEGCRWNSPLNDEIDLPECGNCRYFVVDIIRYNEY